MVDGPMIFEKPHLEIGRNLRGTIPVDVGNQARGVREKILGVEIKDGLQPDLAFGVLDPDVSRIPDEGACGRIKLPVEGGRAERDARKSRAADGHAVEREVNPLLAERADDAILECVEGDRFSADGECPKVEKGELRQAAETFGNPGVNDSVHCQGVIGIDVEGETRVLVRKPL